MSGESRMPVGTPPPTFWTVQGTQTLPVTIPGFCVPTYPFYPYYIPPPYCLCPCPCCRKERP